MTISWSLLIGCAIGYTLGTLTVFPWIAPLTIEQKVRNIIAAWTIVLGAAGGSIVIALMP